MKKSLIACLLFFVACSNSYQEYTIAPLPSEMNTLYLKDSLRYLALADAEQGVIKATFQDKTIADPIFLFYPQEGIKVLIIRDQKHMTQTINIVATYNGMDICKAQGKSMVQPDLFTIPINAYYYKIYNRIRKDLIRNLEKTKSVRINTLGSASVYGTLLAIELSAVEIPLESVVTFGATKFTSQVFHEQLKHNFGNRIIAITHENDISHQVYMGGKYAAFLPEEYLVCPRKKCEEIVYTQERYSLLQLNNQPLNFIHSYAQMYHDSILNMEDYQQSTPFYSDVVIKNGSPY